jgi:hypothetical protein
MTSCSAEGSDKTPPTRRIGFLEDATLASYPPTRQVSPRMPPLSKQAVWYSFTAMFCYEFLSAYIWPWLNAVSIPCLASMHATGEKAVDIRDHLTQKHTSSTIYPLLTWPALDFLRSTVNLLYSGMNILTTTGLAWNQHRVIQDNTLPYMRQSSEDRLCTAGEDAPDRRLR